jgi:hypothetical protein
VSEPTHIQTAVSKEKGVTKVTVGCGGTITAKSHADAFENTTAWSCFVTCPECRKRIGLEPVADVA